MEDEEIELNTKQEDGVKPAHTQDHLHHVGRLWPCLGGLEVGNQGDLR